MKDTVYQSGQQVFTSQGRGRVVYILPSGQILVEFESGEGKLFWPDEDVRAYGQVKALPRHAGYNFTNGKVSIHR